MDPQQTLKDLCYAASEILYEDDNVTDRETLMAERLEALINWISRGGSQPDWVAVAFEAGLDVQGS